MFFICFSPCIHYKSSSIKLKGGRNMISHNFFRKKELGMSPLQFRFFTPFPNSFSRLCGTRKLSFLTLICNQHLIFASLNKSSSHSLKALRASLQKLLRKAKPSDVAPTFSKFLHGSNVGFVFQTDRTRPTFRMGGRHVLGWALLPVRGNEKLLSRIDFGSV